MKASTKAIRLLETPATPELSEAVSHPFERSGAHAFNPDEKNAAEISAYAKR